MPSIIKDSALRSKLSKALVDSKISKSEAEGLVRSAQDGRGVTANERADLRKILDTHGSRFELDAKHVMQRFLGVRPTVPISSGTALGPLLEAALAANGKVTTADAVTILATLRGAEMYHQLTPAQIAELKGFTSIAPELLTAEAKFLFNEATGVSNRTDLWGSYDVDLGDVQTLDLAAAQKFVEDELRGDGSYKRGEGNFRMVRDALVSMPGDGWTLEGRQRMELAQVLPKHLLSTLVMLEKDGGIDAKDAAAIAALVDATRFGQSDPWRESGEHLANALRLGIKTTPEGRAELARLADVTFSSATALSGAGPSYMGSQVPSSSVFANRQYVDRSRATLEATGGVSKAMKQFLERANQLVSPPVTDGSLKVSTLVQLETPALHRMLSAQEKFLLGKAWSLVEGPSTPAMTPAVSISQSSLDDLVSAQVVRPKPLDLSRSVPMSELSGNIRELELMQRVQRAANADGDAKTISLADFQAAMSSGVGFTPTELNVQLPALSAQLERRFRTEPAKPLAAVLQFGVTLGKPMDTVLDERIGLKLRSQVDFNQDMTLVRTNKFVVTDGPARVFTSRDGTKQLSVPERFSNNPAFVRATEVALTAGEWTVETFSNGRRTDSRTVQIPEVPVRVEKDMKEYSAYTMTNGAMPNLVDRHALERYFEKSTDSMGRPITVSRDYFTPGWVNTHLPAGEYAVAGESFTLLLNSRVGRTEYMNGEANLKKTQVLLIDAEGKAHSLTGPGAEGGLTLPDGRSVSVDRIASSVKVRIDGREVTVGLQDRVA